MITLLINSLTNVKRIIIKLDLFNKNITETVFARIKIPFLFSKQINRSENLIFPIIYITIS